MRQNKSKRNRPPPDFVEQVIRGRSWEEMGRHYGTTWRTVRAWASLPEVVTEVAELRAEMQEAAKRRIRALVATATDTLEEVMLNTEEPASARVGAAKAVLSLAVGAPKQEVELSGGLAVRTGPLADLTDEEIALKLEEARRAADGEPADGA